MQYTWQLGFLVLHVYLLHTIIIIFKQIHVGGRGVRHCVKSCTPTFEISRNLMKSLKSLKSHL